MDIRQLTAFVTVAEVGSVTRAAPLLHLMQPSVTRQIRTLEQELGVALFDRTRNGMTLTSAGLVMAERARRALQELSDGRAEITPSPEAVGGVVTVGLMEAAADLLGPALVSRLWREHPLIQLRVVTGEPGHLARWLDDGELDLAISWGAEVSGSAVIPLATERLWLAGPPNARLSQGNPVSLAELAGRPLMLPAPGDPLRTSLEAAAAGLGIDLHIRVITSSLRLRKQLVAQGHGWTVLPAVAVQDAVDAGAVSAAPLCKPELSLPVLLRIAQNRGTPAKQTVSHALKQLVHNVIRHQRWPSARLITLTTETSKAQDEYPRRLNVSA